MQERLESVGVRPEMAAILAAIIKVRYNGSTPDDPIEALELFAGYLMSTAAKLKKPVIIPQDYRQVEVIDLASNDYAELNDSQENAVEELTNIPKQFDRRETQIDAPDSNVENAEFYKNWDDVEIDARIEELNERDNLSSAQWDELSNLEQEQDRRREDENPNDDIEGGQPAILKPEKPVNPKGPAPAEAASLDNDLSLLLTV